MRYVDEEQLVEFIQETDVRLRKRALKGADRVAALEKALRGFLETQPTDAPLNVVGLAEAADMMGVAKQRIYRYEEQGRMPEPRKPNPYDDQLVSGPLFSRTEVEALARDIREEREDRERRRAERERDAAEIKARRLARERKKKELASA